MEGHSSAPMRGGGPAPPPAVVVAVPPLGVAPKGPPTPNICFSLRFQEDGFVDTERKREKGEKTEGDV